MRYFEIFAALCLLIASVSTSYANPYLTCSKDVNATAYDIWMDGATVATNVVPVQGWRYGMRLYLSNPPAGTTEVHVILDCGSIVIADGAHQFEAMAKNMWGVSAKSPLDFTKQIPGAPVGMGIMSSE